MLSELGLAVLIVLAVAFVVNWLWADFGRR